MSIMEVEKLFFCCGGFRVAHFSLSLFAVQRRGCHCHEGQGLRVSGYRHEVRSFFGFSFFFFFFFFLFASFFRYGAQQLTIASNFPKTYEINDRAFLGLVGLATDQQTVFEVSPFFLERSDESFPFVCSFLFFVCLTFCSFKLLRFKSNLYKLREGRPIGVKTLAALTSSTLYERRFGP